MSTPVLAGKAAAFGVIGTLAFSGFATSINKLVEADFSSEFDVADAKDGNGNIFLSAATNLRDMIKVSCIPFDPTAPSVLATAYTNIKRPAPLAIVTIAGFGNTLYDGDWNYMGSLGAPLKLGEFILLSFALRRVGDTPAALPII